MQRTHAEKGDDKGQGTGTVEPRRVCSNSATWRGPRRGGIKREHVRDHEGGHGGTRQLCVAVCVKTADRTAAGDSFSF